MPLLRPPGNASAESGGWADAALGQFGVSAPSYDSYRQRWPVENLNFGRIFRIREKLNLQIRAEFLNIFNRVFLTPPAIGGFAGTNTNTVGQKTNGIYTNGYGYGYINVIPGATGYIEQPRTGQIVAKVTV